MLKHLHKYSIFFVLCTSVAFFQPLPQSELSLQVIQYNQIDYISLNDFIQTHELKSTYYQSKEKFDLIFEDKKIYFSPFSSYFKINDSVYHLTYDVILKNKEKYVPLLPFYHILESINMPVQLVESKKLQKF